MRPRARLRRLRGLGSIASDVAALAALPVTLPASLYNAVVRGWGSVQGFLYSAATGNVSPDQQTALIQQATQDLVRTGVAPQAAQAQATQDANAVLSTFTGAGGLNITWTGAQPSQPGFATAAAQAAATSATDWLASYWPWLAVGGISVWWLSREL